MHQLWESRSGGEFFKLCKILTELPDKFRENYRMIIKTFLYIMDNVKDDFQDCSNFRKCIDVEENLTVAPWYVLVIVGRIDKIYTCRILNPVIIQCKIKGNYTRKNKHICFNTFEVYYYVDGTAEGRLFALFYPFCVP
jgi:hypothetical protein